MQPPPAVLGGIVGGIVGAVVGAIVRALPVVCLCSRVFTGRGEHGRTHTENAQ